MSAPVYPAHCVAAARRMDTCCSSVPKRVRLASVRRTDTRASMPGIAHSSARSMRPGRSSAGSIISGRFDAARTNTPLSCSTPSSWQRS